MSDDEMVDMEAGTGMRVADEFTVLPEGEEKDEEVGGDGGVLGGAADRNLHQIFYQEQPKIDDVRVILRQVFEAVQHQHEKHLMHGDIKMLNIVRSRIDNRLRLIDFDASAKIVPIGGEDESFAGAKFSSAILPPEMIERIETEEQLEKFNKYWEGESDEVFKEKVAPKIYKEQGIVKARYVVKSFRTKGGEPVYEGLPYDLVKASESIDAWALGVLAFTLLTGVTLIPSTRDDDCASGAAMHLLYSWGKYPFVLIELFKKIHDDAARDLVQQLLQYEPKKRPTVASLLEKHPFFHPERDPFFRPGSVKQGDEEMKGYVREMKDRLERLESVENALQKEAKQRQDDRALLERIFGGDDDDATKGKEQLVLGGSVTDKSSNIDRLSYLTYAQALAYTARQAEQPGTSLCVGLYGRWGGGKSTLWKLIKKFLIAEFLEEDAGLLYDVCQLSGKSYHSFSENAKIPFNNAVERLASDPNVSNGAKKAWGEKLEELKRKAAENKKKTWRLRWVEKSKELRAAPLKFLEHLACLFLCIFCACRSCRKGYELDNEDRNGNDVQTNQRQRIEIKSQDARSRRMEFNAIFFSVVLISLFPIWIVYGLIYLLKTCCCCKDREKNDNNIKKERIVGDVPLVDGDGDSATAKDREKNERNMKEEAKQIAGIIAGDVPLGDGDSAQWDVAPCGRFFVIIILQIVRAIVSGISLACSALHYVVCFQWCCCKTNHTPTGAVKYKIVEFNAWTYQGSELLWASLMKELWDAVEAEFGKEVVRYHRAGIALAGENPYDESHHTLSPEQKARKRKRALLMFRARSYLYLFLFLIVLTVLLTLTIMNCKNVDKTCLGKVVNVTNDATDIVEAVESGSEEEGNEADVVAAIIATVAAFCPLLANVITYCKKVLPYLRKTRGDFILEKASGSTKRKDFKEELGFMGEVKTELEYLFDLLATETYHDKEIGCDRSLRLCVFIDDLDRCPKESVVSVLEAVILLLVDGPISVWLAIDSRIVVQCIEAVKLGVFDKANISGHEFLDKIVQLPFSLPELTNDTKKSYLDKIIDEKELDPARVLARFMREGLHKKLGIDLNEEAYQNKDPFLALTRIATELEKKGHIISRHDRKAVIGMTESELIKMVEENPQNASAEQIENLCSIISQATSKLILNRQLEKSDDKKTPETDSKGSISHNDGDMEAEAKDETEESFEVREEANSAKQEEMQVEDGNEKESGESPSDDNVHSEDPPPSGLFMQMLNENDRRWLEAFVPFLYGNPRRMKRIINVFNVSRRIAELRCGVSSPISQQLASKILKMVILVEQWPFQMAWLLQLIEDIKQMSTHSVADSRMNRFLEECFGRDKVLPGPGESCWDMICRVEVYRRFVCELSMSNEDSSNMGTIDFDPHLFEGLLLCNGPDKESSSEGPYAITVHDLRPLGCNMEGGEETCLRSYMVNMPQGITDKVSIIVNKALINYAGKNSLNRGESEDGQAPSPA